MWEKSIRLKVRWVHNKGFVGPEDLWVIPLEEINTMYKGLRAEQKMNEEDSLLGSPTKNTDLLDLKIAILKRVVEVRLAEQNAIAQTALRKAEKDKLLAILADKEDEELRGKSAADIRKLIEEMS